MTGAAQQRDEGTLASLAQSIADVSWITLEKGAGLQVFQEKAARGIATPKHEIELIRARLRRAEEYGRTAAGGER